MALLEIDGLYTGYGASQVLHGVDLAVDAGCATALMGRNGMGKSTTIRAVMGLLPIRQGDVRFKGRSLKGLASHRIAAMGLGWVPEGRRVFPKLTVDEHLKMAARQGPWSSDRVFALLPALAARKNHLGNQLSGGEQQMLAIGRALTTNPDLLLLDEATEGLAPLIRAQIWTCLGAIKAEGVAILVVDKDLEALHRLAERHAVLKRGQVVWQGDRQALDRERSAVRDLIAV